MAFNREDIADIELNTGRVYRTFINHPLGEGDAGADKFGVRVFRDGQPVSLAGASVVGYFIRADGVTEEITSGSVSGNKAVVTLPTACYAVEGNFQLSIVLTGGGVTGTLRIVDGTVVNVTNDPIMDPTGAFPNPEAYEALVERAEDAVETIAGYSVEAVLVSGTNYAITVTTVPEE